MSHAGQSLVVGLFLAPKSGVLSVLPLRTGRWPLSAAALATAGQVAEWQTRTVQVRVSVRTWGFNSPLAHACDLSTDPGRTEPLRLGPFWFLTPSCVAIFSGGLVVAVGVDGEFAQEFAGGCVDDADV